MAGNALHLWPSVVCRCWEQSTDDWSVLCAWQILCSLSVLVGVISLMDRLLDHESPLFDYSFL